VTWAAGKKIELVSFEETEANVTRQMCSRFQLHWLEIDGQMVASQGIPRQLRIERPRLVGPIEEEEEVFIAQNLPDRFPTACPHSQARVPGADPIPCYGPKPGAEDIQDPTGLSPWRPRIRGEFVSPGPGAEVTGRFPAPRYPEAAVTPPGAGRGRGRGRGRG
jgi:hypothetical protein